MARQVLPIVGAVVGFFIPGVGPQMGYMIGSIVGNAVDPMVMRGPSIGDGQVQTSKEGVPIPIIYGTACVSGNIIDLSPVRKSIKKTQQGKGGPVTEEERLHRDYAIGIACHSVSNLLRIWEDEKLVFDDRPVGTMQERLERIRYSQRFKFYKGDEEQLPDPTLEAVHGVGNVPAYRGLCYIVFKNADLTDRRGSVPNYRFEISEGEEIVFPQDRVPCVTIHTSTTSSHVNITDIVPVHPHIDFREIHQTLNFSPGDTRMTSYRLTVGYLNTGYQYYHSSSPELGGMPQVRVFLSTGINGTGNILHDTGWISHVSQSEDADIVNTYYPSRVNLFDDDDPRFNGSFFREYSLLSLPEDRIYRTIQWAVVSPGPVRAGGYTRSIGAQFLTMDPSFYNKDITIIHPEYPDALLNILTGEVLWACWAEDEYIVGGRGSPVKIQTIINDIATRCDLPLDKLDTSEIDGEEVRGLVIAQQYPARNAITSLQQAFFFDPSEYDGKIHFIRRGKPIETIFTVDDFVDDPYEQERKSTIEYPKKLNLIFQNATIGYDSAKATAERNSPDVQVSGERTIEVPIVLIEDEAAQIADKQLKIGWAEAQGTFEFTLPSNPWDHLTTTDVFGVHLRGSSQRMRIEKIERADGTIKIEAKVDRQSAYHSNATGIPLPPPSPPPPTIAGPMVFRYLNIPALVDSNDLLGYYIATAGRTLAYRGGVVERKSEGLDEDFYQVATVPGAKTMGRLLSPVKASSEHYRDTTNIIHLKLFDPTDFETLQSVSDEFLLRENNALALVRSDGSAEIVQFRDAENLGGGIYKLSHLIRGRLNTTPSEHQIDSAVVWLEDVDLVVVDAADLGSVFIHRPTSYGETPEDSALYTNDFSQPKMQTEFPVDLLRYDAVTGAVLWSPRMRFGSDIAPVQSVNWQGYQITYDDGVKTETFTTTDPQHIHDLSTYARPVVVSVSQINRYTGPGPAQTIEIE